MVFFASCTAIRISMSRSLLEQIGEPLEAGGALLDAALRPVLEAVQRPRDQLVGRRARHRREIERRRHRLGDPLQLRPVVEVEPLAVLPLRHEQIVGQRDRGMAGAADRGDLRDRIGEQIGVGQTLVGELVDEGAELAPFSSRRRTR